MSELLVDKLINQHIKIFSGKLYLVNDYVIINCPNFKKLEDLIFLIIRKIYRKFKLDLNFLEDCHVERSENGSNVYFYSIKIPLKKAILIRLKERYKNYLSNEKIELNEEELKFFECVFRENNTSEDPLPLSRLSFYMDIAKENSN